MVLKEYVCRGERGCEPLLAVFLIVALGLSASARAENWPCWRGPRGDSTSLEKGVPTNWDVATQATWKTAVPGIGHASMIVWGDRLFTVTGLPEKRQRQLLSFDRGTGKLLWQQTVVEGPLEKLHPENSYASGTPATDGMRVFVNFRVGDEIVVAAHDFRDGKQLWLVRPGKHVGEWGFSNEPVLYRDKVIVDGDSKGDSFLIVLDQASGETLWRVDRTHRGISYSAPFVRQMAGRLQLVQCGDRCVTSFDPDTGKGLWTVDGPSQEFCATPFFDEKSGLLFISSSWPKAELLAIRPDGTGNVTKSHVVWRDTKGAPYIPSLLVAGDYLLSVNTAGTAYCYDPATGKVHWKEKLGRTHASPVWIEGLVYFINDDGEIHVIRPGTTFDRVAKHNLGEPCYASPAISDGQVFLRGFKTLYCIGKPATGTTTP
jgi:outer membrane protein assembly factor BamB